MGKLEIGDKVRISKHNAIGEIVDIDHDWIYPYEVRILKIDGADVKRHELDELYLERDLYKIIEFDDKEKVVNLSKPLSELPQYPMKPFDLEDEPIGQLAVELTIEEEIERVIKKIKEFPFGQSRETSIAITKLQEARMWMEENNRVIASKLTE